jgi:hypothetical protein
VQAWISLHFVDMPVQADWSISLLIRCTLADKTVGLPSLRGRRPFPISVWLVQKSSTRREHLYVLMMAEMALATNSVAAEFLRTLLLGE